jgi:DNA replication protein DnaC
MLEVLEDRNQAHSTVITSQFKIKTWHEVVGSPTLADSVVERILTRAHRIELQGESIRPLARGAESKEAQS